MNDPPVYIWASIYNHQKEFMILYQNVRVLYVFLFDFILDAYSNFTEAEHPYVICKEDIDQGLDEWWKNFSEDVPKHKESALDNQASYEELIKRTIGLSGFGSDMRFGMKECSEAARGKFEKKIDIFLYILHVTTSTPFARSHPEH